MASTNLFAPQVPTIQPAFVYKDIGMITTVFKFYFNFSYLNSKEDISGIYGKTLDSQGKFLYHFIIPQKNIYKENNQYFFWMVATPKTETALIKNNYFQTQIFLISKKGAVFDQGFGAMIPDSWVETNKQYFSESSQVSLLRPISEIDTFDIEGIESGKSDLFTFGNNIIEGSIKYIDNSTLEYIDTYEIEIKKDGNSIYKTGIINNNLKTSFSTKVDYYRNPFEPTISTYKIIFTGTTINGFKIDGNIDPRFKKTFSTTQPSYIPIEAKNLISFKDREKEGAVKISITPDFSALQNINNKAGRLEIYRASEDNYFTNWKKLFVIDITNEQWALYPTVSFLDCYCKFGEIYYYYIKYINNDTNEEYLFCDKISDTKYLPFKYNLDYNDIYLSDKNNLLHLELNPNITGLKYVTQESITNTLGGKYPIIRKNGNTKYKQFNLSGTLYFDLNNVAESYDSQNTSMQEYFDTTYINYFLGFEKAFKNISGRGSWDYLEKIDDESVTSYFDEIKYKNISYKDYGRQKQNFNKRVRDLVIDFLTNGQPKLFRTFEEGNMIIYLSNISFTPNKQLGRAVYDFSATATEFCETTEENMLKYGLSIDNTLNINNLLVLKATSKQDANINDGSIIFTPYIGAGEGTSWTAGEINKDGTLKLFYLRSE